MMNYIDVHTMLYIPLLGSYHGFEDAGLNPNGLGNRIDETLTPSLSAR